MRLSLSQYAVRLTCGLGLLLLPAVQEKLCAWPEPKQRESHDPAAPLPVPAPDQSSESPKRKTKRPLTLAALLPDVAPPRWPKHARLTAVQRLRPLPVGTWVSSSTRGDDRSAPPAVFDALFFGRWPRQPMPQRLRTFGDAGLRHVRAERHLFQTSIVTTGPPYA